MNLHWLNKMEKKYTTLSEQVQNPVDKIDNPEAHVHDRSLSQFGTITSITSDGVRLVLWARTSPLSKMEIDLSKTIKCQIDGLVNV
jgi:hypothetical protein